MALVALGFFAARWTGLRRRPAPVATASVLPSDDVFATVRSVRPDPAGQVQIAFDETRRRVVSGTHGRSGDSEAPAGGGARRERLGAGGIDGSLEGAHRVERGAGRPVERAGARSERRRPAEGARGSEAPGRRSAGAQDPVAGAAEDANPAVRMQVVDLLVAHRDDSVVGVLQGLVQREDNNYVRLKLEKALKDMNASIGTF